MEKESLEPLGIDERPLIGVGMAVVGVMALANVESLFPRGPCRVPSARWYWRSAICS